METIIKNSHLIKNEMSEMDFFLLEQKASKIQKLLRITFKVIYYRNNNITIEARQGKNLNQEYLSPILLSQEAKSLFEPVFRALKVEVNVNPIPYSESPVDVVTNSYLRHNMTRHKKRLKDLANDTGIDKSNLSAWINGIREMSQPVKAMFYSYFESLNKKVTLSSERYGPESNLGKIAVRLANGLSEHYNSEVKVSPFTQGIDSCIFLFYIENLDITNHFHLGLKAVDSLLDDDEFYIKNIRNIISVIDSRYWLKN